MKKRRSKARCTPSSEDADCCAVKAVVTIDERGQMVLPKELRDEIDLDEKLNSDYEQLSIRMQRMIQNRFSVNEIIADNRYIGNIQFIVG